MEATGIKLFGKNIAYPDRGRITTNLPVFSTATATATATAAEESTDGGYGEHGGIKHARGLRKEESCLNKEDSKRKHSNEDQIREKKQENKSSPKAVVADSDGNPKTPITEDTNTSKIETLDDSTNSQSKDLKKPDKTVPCPRCDSMDTKFCYYNNYNVKQPRHFCKSCQRYWTAGGTMRNMPVGAGRRKNKNPASHYGFVTISQSAQIEVSATSNGIHGVPPKVISFGSISPNVDSGLKSAVSCRDRETGDDCSSGSSVTTSNSVAEKMQDGNGFHSTHVPCIPGVSWSYNPWNSVIPIPGVFPPGYPQMSMPFYPSPYWNYIPWLPPNVQPSSDLNSFNLGKHSRNGELINPNGSEEPKKQKSSVLIPKTLRIDDPDEAAKSSIWSTLGIKNERGLFKAFQTKNEENKQHPESKTSSVLHVNPAALSRSLCFQERA